MKRPRVVLDTNVLVSGLRSKRGAAFRVLALLPSERFIANVSVPLVVEYEKALLAPASAVQSSPRQIRAFIDYFCALADKRMIHFLWRPRLRDPKDEMVLEIAVAGRCQFIVTFNVADFAGVDEFGIEVITPHQFLQVLGEST